MITLSNEEIATTLRTAADVLRRDGWIQGDYHEDRDGGRAHCAVGAIEKACTAPKPWSSIDLVVTRLGQYLRESDEIPACPCGRPHDPSEDGVTHWNDAKGRTADDVITALEKAAIYVEEKVQP